MLKTSVILASLLLVTAALPAQELPPPPEDLVEFPVAEEPGMDPSPEAATDEEAEAPKSGDLSELGEAEPDSFTHTLKFDFISRVSFTKMATRADDLYTANPPYMEIEYQTQWEKDLNLARGRGNFEVDATYNADHWGSLAESEFFTCNLQIDIERMPFKGNVTLKTTKDENDNEKFSLTVKLDLQREDFKEDWFSFCSQGSYELNTKGETEDYNYQVLKMIEPSLAGLSLDEVDPTEVIRIDLTVETQSKEDYDIDSIISYTGSGTLTLEPL